MRGKNLDYNFTIRTTLDIRPENISIERYGHFMRIPGKGQAIWGFAEETGRDLFAVDFSEKIIART